VTGDDLRERIARAIYADDVENERTDFREGVTPCYYDNADAVLAVLSPQPTPSPVPPWPGAVLSGCVDEDGVPTWLAQAGQVRGEQVRSWHGSGWVAATHSRYAWVEVRAPRAVPEPETERVPWWEANDRELVDGLLCVENAMIREVGREGDRVYVCGYEDPDNPDEDDRGDWQRNYWYGRDGFDGTVEVLRRDGDR